MHLIYKTSRYKDKVYRSYFIAESYREGERLKNERSGALESLQINDVIKLSSYAKLFLFPDRL